MSTVLILAVQFALSILLAALAAYLGIWLFERATRDIDEWEEIRRGNPAIGVTLAAIVIGLAIILRPAVAGGLPSGSGRLAPDLGPSLYVFSVLLLMLVRALLGLVLGIAAILFAVWLFIRLTQDLDEMAELRDGNMAVAAVLAGVIIATAVLVSPAVTGITDGLLAVLFG